jgi:hypothetical protein
MTTTGLKLFAMFFMSLDHIAKFIPESPIAFHWIGRLAAPLFTFCAIQGFYYSKNKNKYLVRMYLFGVGMAIISLIANYACKDRHGAISITNNFFVTLFVMCLIIYIIEELNQSKKKLYLIIFVIWQIISTIICIIISELVSVDMPGSAKIFYGAILGNIFFNEGGIIFITLGVLMYTTKNSKKNISIAYVSFCVFYFIFYLTDIMTRIGKRIDYYYSDTVYFIFRFFSILLGVEIMRHGNESFLSLNYQWMMIGALPFILLYNNKKGKGLKYLFYLFYPIHILILYFVRSFIIIN